VRDSLEPKPGAFANFRHARGVISVALRSGIQTTGLNDSRKAVAPPIFRMVAAPDPPDFDPRIIERFVESAYRRANAIFVGSVTAGVALGAAFGNVENRTPKQRD
jgi:hypothetical protein